MKKARATTDPLIRAARILKAAGHPARLAILESLLDGARTVADIQNTLKISQPNLSQHLSLLKRVGLVRALPSGPMRCYYLSFPALVKSIVGMFTREPEVVNPDTAKVIAEAVKKHPGVGVKSSAKTAKSAKKAKR